MKIIMIEATADDLKANRTIADAFIDAIDRVLNPIKAYDEVLQGTETSGGKTGMEEFLNGFNDK